MQNWARQMKIERGNIVLVDFDPTKGEEIKKTRPAVVVTNDLANEFARVLVIVPLTSQKLEKIYPHEVFIPKQSGLTKDSKANISQMRAIDKLKIKKVLGIISKPKIKEIDSAIKLHLSLE